MHVLSNLKPSRGNFVICFQAVVLDFFFLTFPVTAYLVPIFPTIQLYFDSSLLTLSYLSSAARYDSKDTE